MRVGIGYDVHRLVNGRRLVIGGVEIPFEKGLLGHSDADVLVHAVIDALLGAAGLGDIGHLFPDTDPKYEGIDSLVLLKRVGELLADKGFSVGNVDSIIVAEAPRMAPHIPLMEEKMARALGAAASAIHVKATTEEGLGFTGLGEGIAAQAIALIIEESKQN